MTHPAETPEVNIFASVTAVASSATPVIQAIKPRIDKAVQDSKSFVISSDADVQRASEALAEWKKIVRENEADRKKTVKPFNDGVAQINARFKENSAELVAAIEIMEPKIIAWQQEKERKAAEERARLEQEAIQAANHEELATGVEVEPVPVPASAVDTSFAGKSSGLAVTKRWTAEVEDISKVDRKFLVVDQTAVNAEMKRLKELWQDGSITEEQFTQGIAGVKIFQKMGTLAR